MKNIYTTRLKCKKKLINFSLETCLHRNTHIRELYKNCKVTEAILLELSGRVEIYIYDQCVTIFISIKNACCLYGVPTMNNKFR